MSGRRKRAQKATDALGGAGAGREPSGTSAEIAGIARRHLRFGWWALLCFLTLGLVLESLNGFKVAWYLAVSNSMRREMWTLAHAHGTLLAVLNLVLGATLHRAPGWSRRGRNLASASLLGATVLLPVGFFLAGLFAYEGDPGLGIVLVPLGAVLLWVAVFLAARGESV